MHYRPAPDSPIPGPTFAVTAWNAVALQQCQRTFVVRAGRLGAAGVSVAAVGERSDNPFDAKTVQLDQNFKTNGYWPVRLLFKRYMLSYLLK